MITDIHCHYVPPDFFARLESDEASGVSVERRDGERVDVRVGTMLFGLNPVFFDLDRQVARMDALGVERSVLSLATPFISYKRDAVQAAELATSCNDGLAHAVRRDPRRFAAWAFLPMQDPDAAARELRRCVEEHGFVGGHIATNVNGRYPHEDAFRPVFDAARALDVPLFMHPADPAGRERTAEYELTVVAGYMFDTTIAIFKMMCSGFLDRYRDLKLVCAHTGAYAPALRARMQREVDTNPELRAKLTRPVETYLAQLYCDTVCFEPEILRYATGVFPASHMLMGSDGPFPLGEPDPVGFVTRAIEDDTHRNRVLGGNAQALFGW